MRAPQLQGLKSYKELEKEIADELKRFCADHFEEKPGAYILRDALYGIYLNWKSLDNGLPLSKSMFKYHAMKHFMSQWSCDKDSRVKGVRCYRNVAVRQVAQAAAIPVQPPMPVALPVALPAAIPPAALPVALPLAVPRAPKPTVYILELEHGRVYVGCSRHVDQRIAQHLSGLGSAFTRMFKPTGVRLPRLGNMSGNGDGPERDETLRYMVQRGIRLVRGWKYALVDMPDADFADAEANIRELSDLCRRCGHAGHFVADCRMAYDRLGNKLV